MRKMEDRSRVFGGPYSIFLTEMRRICQDQLRHAIELLPRDAKPGEVLRSAGTALSHLSGICASLVEGIEVDKQSPTPIKAVKELQNVIQWNDFIEFMQTQSVDPQPIYLYRAHSYNGDDIPTFNADINTPFDLTFKRTITIDEFTEFLNEHLKKTRVTADTCMISTSSILPWTVHLTGQKSRCGSAGLAIFDLRRWRRITTSTPFRVRDVCKFLDVHSQAKTLDEDLREWAINCDEYVSVGNIPQEVLVRWVSWDDLFDPSIGLLQRSFLWSYTLGVFGRDFSLVFVTLDMVCSKVVAFARVLAGSQDELVVPFIKAILKDGIEVWGYATPTPRIEVERTACNLIELSDLEGIACLSTY